MENISNLQKNKNIFTQQEEITENINKYDFYLLIFNLQSKHNVGTLIRSASAFKCKKIFVVGENKKVLKSFFGHQGTLKKMEFVFFPKLDDVINHCKVNSIFICGVEIGEGSAAIQTRPFKGHTLFVLGNEGSGMNYKQKEMCDHLVYIPQYSSKTGSLNVAIAGSIIFHHFAIWAEYKEAKFTDEKYNVQKNTIDYSGFKNEKITEENGLNNDEINLNELQDETNNNENFI